VGELVATHVIPRPHSETYKILDFDQVSKPAEQVAPVALPTIEELKALPVRELRELARRITGLGIQGRDISRANKQQLLEEIRRKL